VGFNLGDRKQVNAMAIEILAFLAVAASLVLAGFATGPIVARRVNSSGQRHYHY
jgi:hypothetical protein